MRTAENNDESRSAATLLLADVRFAPLAPILAQRREIGLVANCRQASDVVSATTRLRPDVLLLGADSAGSLSRLGLVLRRLRLRARETNVLVVSERSDCEFICTILRHGARGRIRPAASPDELGKAIVAVMSGDVWLERKLLAEGLGRLALALESRAARRKSPPGDTRGALTDRENEIVTFVAKGMTNKEVARKLSVSHETIKKHLKKVFVKLGVHHRAEVILHYS